MSEEQKNNAPLIGEIFVEGEAPPQYYQAFLNAQKKSEDAAAKSEAAAGRAEAAAAKIAVDQEYIETQVFAAGGAAEAAAGAANAAAESERKAKADADRAVGAAQRAESAAATDPDRHAEFFTITENGVLSVKDGAELPEYLVIPELVGEVAVDSIATGAFMGNTAIKTVVFPKTVKHIPESCFNESTIEQISNVDHVTSIGKNAFRGSNIKSVKMPNLTATGGASFAYCCNLTHADLGKVTKILAGDFNKCYKLSRIESDDLITSVGKAGFAATPRLANASFVKNLTSIENGGFLMSGLDYDWASLTNCTFGTGATSLQLNPTDFWSECTTYDCENPLPTLLCQNDPRWKDRQIGTSGITYGDGCVIFSLMHIYSGLNNIAFASVEEFEQEVGTDFLNAFSDNMRDMPSMAESLGMTATGYETYIKENLQALYDALNDGKYAIMGAVSNYIKPTMYGHVNVAYGLTKDGKIKIADSGYGNYLDRTIGNKYKLPYKTMMVPDNEQSVSFYIVEKTK